MLQGVKNDEDIPCYVCRSINPKVPWKCNRQSVPPKEKSTANNLNIWYWYGICEKCGTKGGLHRFEGKRYCAKCHAWLSAEKKCGVKTTQTHIAEE